MSKVMIVEVEVKTRTSKGDILTSQINKDSVELFKATVRSLGGVIVGESVIGEREVRV